MFGYILISLVTVLHLYVFWRAGSVPFIKDRLSRKALIGTGVGLWTLFVLGWVVGHEGTGPFATMLEFLGMNWMGTVFIFTDLLVTVDIITLFGFAFKRFVPLLRGCVLAGGVVLSVIALVQGLRPPVISNYDVKMPGLSQEMDGMVIVALSDLHLGSLIGKEWLQARVKQVEEQSPDMVVLLGDIVEGHDEPDEELMSILGSLQAPLGVWAVLGNHEYHGRRHSDEPQFHYDGIPVLNNSWTEVAPALILAGVEDLTNNHRRGKGGDPVSIALEGRPPGATVFLSHTPWDYEKASNEGVGLMLSGHTHGGQIWPFGYLTKRFYPLLAGRYDVNGMTVIVCRGTGTWGPRMRLWHPGEILHVTLHAE